MDIQLAPQRAPAPAVDSVNAPPVHPCQACGACCACFRVDFAAEELDDNGGRVPSGLAVEVTSRTWRMRGTDHVPIRCAALTGQVGGRLACGIYEWRPDPCRELQPGSDACERARARHGLPPLPDAPIL